MKTSISNLWNLEAYKALDAKLYAAILAVLVKAKAALKGK